jgi:hypothetical protein
MQKKTDTLFDRIHLPTRVIVHRFELGAGDLSAMIEKGELSPKGSDMCELEAGGQIVARGRIVRRMGRYVFKVLETGKENGT